MQLIKLGYEIMRCPDGEEALAFLERVAREAYGSEESIDDGRDQCEECKGTGRIFDIRWYPCSKCNGNGWIRAREPSSHRLLRKVLKLNRRERLARKVEMYLVDVADGSRLASHGEARAIVDLVLNDLRDDPPHTSILDHLQITVRVLASRGVSHEWVRHRIGWGYLQRSTRYCGGGERLTDEGIQVIDRDESHFAGGDDGHAVWIDGLAAAERSYRDLVALEKPQIAREVLPIGVYAPFIATGTFTAWHHFFRLRLGPRAHPDMHRIAQPLLEALQCRIPIVFDVPGLI